MFDRNGRRRRQRGRGVLYAAREVALEPAQEAVRVAGRRGAPLVRVPALQSGLRRPVGDDEGGVKVRRAGDEGVCDKDEQHRARRAARPNDSPPFSVQLFAQRSRAFRSRIGKAEYNIKGYSGEAKRLSSARRRAPRVRAKDGTGGGFSAYFLRKRDCEPATSSQY